MINNAFWWNLKIHFIFLLLPKIAYFILMSGNAPFDASSVNQLKEFIKRCQGHLKIDSNLFWVALQSNQMADTGIVQDDFKKELEAMKEEFKKSGWILPTLEANMRNQINISNINVESNSRSRYKMQSSINKLKAGTNIVGEVPVLFKIKDKDDWKKKRDAVLKHCFQEMDKKDNKNVVVLFDDSMYKDVGKDIKRLIKGKTVVEYPPSNQDKQKGISSVKDFIEKDNHILVTKNRYFNGCEAANIIFLTYGRPGVRNSLLRGVQNIICVQVGEWHAIIEGMKEDKRCN